MRIQEKKESVTLAEKIEMLAATALDDIICVYLFTMLAVFPFYNKEGYSHIGTDKGMFFCRISALAGVLASILLLLWLGGRLVGRVKKCRKQHVTHDKPFCKIKEGGTLRGWEKGLSGRKLDAVDCFTIFYGAVLLLSYLFAIDREAALWGEKGWYMGFLPHVFLIGIYFLVSRFWKPRRWMFYLIFPVSGAVFFMGCVNRFGYYPFGMESAGSNFISTIGNINWYCGYAVTVMFAGAVLLWLGREMKAWQKALLAAYTVLGYLSLLLQGSDSGLLALMVVLLFMFCLSVQDSGRMLIFWQQMTFVWACCLGIRLILPLAPEGTNFVGFGMRFLIKGPLCIGMTLVSILALLLVWLGQRKGRYRKKIFRVAAWITAVGAAAAVLGILLMGVVNTLRPGSLGALSENPLFTFNASWGSNRGATWSAGWRCFAAQDPLHKLTGVGPDCMWSYISSGSDPALLADVQETFGEARLTNAHNEWLTVLINEGILGLIGFGGMVVCGIREFLWKAKGDPLVMACGFSLLAYTVNNIFSFQQAMSVGTIFVMFGMGKAFIRCHAGD